MQRIQISNADLLQALQVLWADQACNRATMFNSHLGGRQVQLSLIQQHHAARTQ